MKTGLSYSGTALYSENSNDHNSEHIQPIWMIDLSLYSIRKELNCERIILCADSIFDNIFFSKTKGGTLGGCQRARDGCQIKFFSADKSSTLGFQKNFFLKIQK